MKRVFINLAIALIAITYLQIGGAQKAEAFCIYNHAKSTNWIKVWQTKGYDSVFTSFKQEIAPGKHKCCNWKNDDCNPSGKRDRSLGFGASYTGFRKKDEPKATFSIPAGGTMTCLLLKGTQKPTCPPSAADLKNRRAVKLNISTHSNVLLKGVNGGCLEIGGWKKSNGANVNLWKCGKNQANQRWNIDQKGQIRSALNGKCLDIAVRSLGQLKNGSKVTAHSCHSGPNQSWEIKHGRLVGPVNFCLDVSDKKGKNGANVHAWKCHKGANQQWQIADKP